MHGSLSTTQEYKQGDFLSLHSSPPKWHKHWADDSWCVVWWVTHAYEKLSKKQQHKKHKIKPCFCEPSMLETCLPDRKAGSSSSTSLCPGKGSSSLFSLHRKCFQITHTCKAKAKANGRVPGILMNTETQIQEYQCFPMVASELIIYIGSHMLQFPPRCSTWWRTSTSAKQSFLWDIIY